MYNFKSTTYNLIKCFGFNVIKCFGFNDTIYNSIFAFLLMFLVGMRWQIESQPQKQEDLGSGPTFATE